MAVHRRWRRGQPPAVRTVGQRGMVVVLLAPPGRRQHGGGGSQLHLNLPRTRGRGERGVTQRVGTHSPSPTPCDEPTTMDRTPAQHTCCFEDDRHTRQVHTCMDSNNVTHRVPALCVPLWLLLLLLLLLVLPRGAAAQDRDLRQPLRNGRPRGARGLQQVVRHLGGRAGLWVEQRGGRAGGGGGKGGGGQQKSGWGKAWLAALLRA